MNRLYALFAVLALLSACWPAQYAEAAIALVSGSQATFAGSSDPVSAPYAANNAAGNLLICIVAVRGGQTVSGVTDSRGNTWTLAVQSTINTIRSEIWYAENSASGSNTVSVDFSATGGYEVTVVEFSGAATSSSLDQTNSNVNTNTTTHSHGSITTYAGAGLIITGGIAFSTYTETPNGSFTALLSGTRGTNQYRITSGSESTNGAFTSGTNQSTHCTIASFKEPGGGGGATLFRRNSRRAAGSRAFYRPTPARKEDYAFV